jgi:hypothetical protein
VQGNRPLDAVTRRLEGTQHTVAVYFAKADRPPEEDWMSPSKTQSQPSRPEPQAAASRAIPTFIATDLLEKLIADRDARAVDRLVKAPRRH